jgi:hypothetical protein
MLTVLARNHHTICQVGSNLLAAHTDGCHTPLALHFLQDLATMVGEFNSIFRSQSPGRIRCCYFTTGMADDGRRRNPPVLEKIHEADLNGAA